MLKLRLFVDADAPVLGQIMYDAVHQGTTAFYNEAQRAAWMPEPRSGAHWLVRLQTPQTWVAEDAQGIAGFMTLALDGHIDLAFVRPDTMGSGVARMLYDQLEQFALDQQYLRLYSEASHLARRFFARRGWRLVKTQSVVSNGVTMQNHQMEKMLLENAPS
jgi:putative acetyltransferase